MQRGTGSGFGEQADKPARVGTRAHTLPHLSGQVTSRRAPPGPTPTEPPEGHSGCRMFTQAAQTRWLSSWIQAVFLIPNVGHHSNHTKAAMLRSTVYLRTCGHTGLHADIPHNTHACDKHILHVCVSIQRIPDAHITIHLCPCTNMQTTWV